MTAVCVLRSQPLRCGHISSLLSPTGQRGKKRGIYLEMDRIRSMTYVNLKKGNWSRKVRRASREDATQQTVTLYVIGNAGVQIESSAQSRKQLLTELVIPSTDDIWLPITSHRRASEFQTEAWTAINLADAPPAALTLCLGIRGYGDMIIKRTTGIPACTAHTTHHLTTMCTNKHTSCSNSTYYAYTASFIATTIFLSLFLFPPKPSNTQLLSGWTKKQPPTVVWLCLVCC